jgi:hypothetical protein
MICRDNLRLMQRCLLAVSLCLAVLAAAQEPRVGPGTQNLGGCNHSTGRYRRTFQNGTLVLAIGANDEQAEDEDTPCAAELRDGSGDVIFKTADEAVSAVLVDDVNGDREMEVVLENYSGGAHCCWRYDIVNAGKEPRLVGEFSSSHEAAFRASKDKVIVIMTESGAFDYFDGLCYACSPSAMVYMVLEGERFRDVSPLFVKLYDDKIEKLRAQLTPERLQAFSASDGTSRESDLQFTKGEVLGIVLAYLCSGRPQQAWEALGEMWPKEDQVRIRGLIEKQFGGGVLKSIAQWNANHPSPVQPATPQERKH